MAELRLPLRHDGLRLHSAPFRLCPSASASGSALVELAREILGVHNDAEVLRLALDHLLNHFTGRLEEKE